MRLGSDSEQPRAWVVVPAAGSGSRMGGDKPKQYLELASLPILIHTLLRLNGDARVSGICVVVSDGDPYWPQLTLPPLSCALWVALGGSQRCYSVLNGINKLLDQGAKRSDWVLVHDAARPCLALKDLARLLDELWSDSIGGILATAASDTLKRTDQAGRILQTVDRSNVWRAQTPQMFRVGMLFDALTQALAKKVEVTDEAQALELAGWQPKIVESSDDNIKITRPADLVLAEAIMNRQAMSQ